MTPGQSLTTTTKERRVVSAQLLWVRTACLIGLWCVSLGSADFPALRCSFFSFFFFLPLAPLNCPDLAKADRISSWGGKRHYHNTKGRWQNEAEMLKEG